MTHKSTKKIIKNNIAVRLKEMYREPVWLRDMYAKKFSKDIEEGTIFRLNYGRCNDILKNHVTIRESEAKNIAVILGVKDYKDLFVK